MLINSLLFIIGLMAVDALPFKRQQSTKLGGVNLAVRSCHLSFTMKLIPGMRVWNDHRRWKWIILLSGHGPDHSFHIERSEPVCLPFCSVFYKIVRLTTASDFHSDGSTW
jgi:hypothetical protein